MTEPLMRVLDRRPGLSYSVKAASYFQELLSL
jgi:hypothetical protein